VGSETRVHVAEYDVDLYPDAAITCGGASPTLVGAKQVIEKPRLIFEVLSPATEHLDRAEKFDFYRGIPGLTYYLLIAQDRMRVEQYRRATEGWLLKTFVSAEEEVHFPEIKWSFTLAELYQGVDVPSGIFVARETLEKPTGNLSLFGAEVMASSKPVPARPVAPAPKAASPAVQPAPTASIPGSDGTVLIFCDGACSGNPGPGGWGTIVEIDGERRELSGGSPKTTNNQMELQALIEGLKAIPPKTRVKVVTDSEYLMKGATSWVKGWIKNGWKTASKQPVKNKEYWQELHDLLQERSVKFEWVKGHAGHEENERCDELAREAAARYR
jgi:ribonuclease HI